MRKLKQTLLFIFTIVLIGCCTKKTEMEIIECKRINSIDMLPDSTFMSEVLMMQYTDNLIFFIEKHSRQLIVLKPDFSECKRIGYRGVGPQELLDPRNFIIYNDTAYLIDIGNNAVKSYTLDENRFVKQVKTSVLSEKRIFVNDSKLYLAAFNRQTQSSLARIKLNDDSLNVYFWGKSFEFNQPLQNVIRNKRDLLFQGDYYYAVSDNLPLVEKYCFSNDSLLKHFDYSFIPIIKDNLSIINSKSIGTNTYTAFVRDSYMYRDDLYLLISQQGNEFRANVIIRIELVPDFNIVGIYLLPGKVYSTFCVKDNIIFAFNSNNTSIEQIKF